MMTLAELVEAYKTPSTPERVLCPLMIDNDDTYAYEEYYELDGEGNPVDEDSECVFSMHPGELLEQALDLLGIPYDYV